MRTVFKATDEQRLAFARTLVRSGRLSDGRPEPVRPTDELWPLLVQCGVWNATHAADYLDTGERPRG